MITATRYHDISCGHRVHGHESKCQHLHGHNYRIHFTVGRDDEALDDIGRVLDFSVIKSRLCMWIEEHWDHKFLVWEDDDLMRDLLYPAGIHSGPVIHLINTSIVWVQFNPTAENMAEFLLKVVGPLVLDGTGCQLLRVSIDETRKCSAAVEL